MPIYCSSCSDLYNIFIIIWQCMNMFQQDYQSYSEAIAVAVPSGPGYPRDSRSINWVDCSAILLYPDAIVDRWWVVDEAPWLWVAMEGFQRNTKIVAEEEGRGTVFFLCLLQIGLRIVIGFLQYPLHLIPNVHLKNNPN